jgi:hypothetical protein
MRILSALLSGCLIWAAAPLLALAPPADAMATPQEAAPWVAKDLAGIWDFTIGEEGPDAFRTEMVLTFAADTLSGVLNLGSNLACTDLTWAVDRAALSFSVEMGAGHSLNFTMTRDGNKIVGSVFDGDEEVDAISAQLNIEKTKAAVAKAAAIARGEVVEGVAMGDRAPDVSGTDLEGVKFKLSDYKGKIVMLDFWGDW